MGRTTPAALTTCALLLLLLPSCNGTPPPPPDQQAELIEKGRRLFFLETFNGNGRTCGTCHPAENRFTIDPAFIARLPKENPLFVAEFTPALSRNFENPRLMREFGLILENLDGFDDLENRFVMRGVPHTLALRNSINSPNGPRTGWSGDGAPGDGALRSFATGAVIQHFTKSLNRVPGVDFRLPTDEELDALEAFQLSLGRQADITLPLKLKGTIARRGQEIFLDNNLGKCNLCHFNAGANAQFGTANLGNANFNTGVEALPDQPARLTTEKVPPDDGLGHPGDSTFNVPPLVEAASTGPFFHNNAIETIEGAVAFYDGEAFNNSPAGVFLRNTSPAGTGIELDGTQIVSVAAFLRVINALEAIRQGDEGLKNSLAVADAKHGDPQPLLAEAVRQLDAGAGVLAGGGLHPLAVLALNRASRFARNAAGSAYNKEDVQNALREAANARMELVE